jgi:MFS transporter, ACS family, hexuronate transporter
VVWLVQTSTSLSVLSFGPLAPFLQTDLGLSRGEIGWLSSAFYFSPLLILIPSGWIIDRVGVRKVLVASLAELGALVLAAALAPVYALILAFVALAGFGANAVMPSTTKAVVDWFPVSARATAMGIKQTGYTTGGMLGGFLLPTVALLFGWRGALLLVGGLALVLALVARSVYQDYHGEDRLNAGVSLRDIPKVFANRNVQLLALASGLLNLMQAALAAYLVLYFHETLLLSVVVAGAYLGLLQASGIVGRIGWGMISDRLLGGKRKAALLIVVACAILSLLAMAFLTPLTPAWAPALLVVFTGVTFLGWAGLYLTISSEMGGRTHPGVTIGAVGSVANFGIFLGPPLFGYAVDISGSYPVAWLSMAAVTVVALVALLNIREGPQFDSD